MVEHPIEQPIRGIDLPDDCGRRRDYTIGRNGVTRIEACQKSGMYASIPYVRVWVGDVCEAEFCQHNLVGVYFSPEIIPAFAGVPPAGGWPADHTGVPSCTCTECIPF